MSDFFHLPLLRFFCVAARGRTSLLFLGPLPSLSDWTDPYLFIVTALGVCCSTWACLSLRPAGALLGCGVWASRCSGFSSCGARAHTGSAVSCSKARGIEPTSPVLAGGFLSTAPPGKSQERLQAKKTNLRAQRTQHSAFLQHVAVFEAPDPIQL